LIREVEIPDFYYVTRKRMNIATTCQNEIVEKNEFHFSSQLVAKFDCQQKSFWIHWKPQPRPCFNLELLNSLRACGAFISQTKGKITSAGKEHPVDYCILLSDNPKAFNLGGDLELFIQLIQDQDYPGLLHYGQLCIEVLYCNYIAYGLPLTTIALVQGLCLGGGFEAALSSDILIAEQSARFGFPEISFNLFPGMGAYSLLTRRLGQRLADKLISSGKRYTAQEMFDLGLVDVLVKDGEGYCAVKELIAKRERNRNGFKGLAVARRLTQTVEYSELQSIVEAWAQRALHLTSKDLQLMKRFARGQG
jgi:DSF synthase